MYSVVLYLTVRSFRRSDVRSVGRSFCHSVGRLFVSSLCRSVFLLGCFTFIYFVSYYITGHQQNRQFKTHYVYILQRSKLHDLVRLIFFKLEISLAQSKWPTKCYDCVLIRRIFTRLPAPVIYFNRVSSSVFTV